MATKLPALLRSAVFTRIGLRAMSGGQFGDGAGKGGGAGGTVREAGGAFGKMEAAHEEQYFRKMQQEQFEKLKHMMEDEVDNHEIEIRRHQEAIDRHKKQMQRLKKEQGDSSDSN